MTESVSVSELPTDSVVYEALPQNNASSKKVTEAVGGKVAETAESKAKTENLASAPTNTAGPEVPQSKPPSPAAVETAPAKATNVQSVQPARHESSPIIIQLNLPSAFPQSQYGIPEQYRGPQKNNHREADVSPQNGMKILAGGKPESTESKKASPAGSSPVTKPSKELKDSPRSKPTTQQAADNSANMPKKEKKSSEDDTDPDKTEVSKTENDDAKKPTEENQQLGVPYSQMYKDSVPPELYGKTTTEKKSISQQISNLMNLCCCGRMKTSTDKSPETKSNEPMSNLNVTGDDKDKDKD